MLATFRDALNLDDSLDKLWAFKASMRDTGHTHYLEAGVLLAGPLQLIQLLYQGARENVQLARRYLAEGDALARARPVSKATEILAELILSLNPATEKAPKLAELYRYIQDLILEA